MSLISVDLRVGAETCHSWTRMYGQASRNVQEIYIGNLYFYDNLAQNTPTHVLIELVSGFALIVNVSWDSYISFMSRNRAVCNEFLRTPRRFRIMRLLVNQRVKQYSRKEIVSIALSAYLI